MQEELTTAVPMLCAITLRDSTTVLVIRDIMEMDGFAKVSLLQTDPGNF